MICRTANRFLWVLLALQVLLIGAAVQNEGLHNWLHGHESPASHGYHHEGHECPHEQEDTGEDHLCAVTLFAEGLELAAIPALELHGGILAGQLPEDAPPDSGHVRWILLVARGPPLS